MNLLALAVSATLVFSANAFAEKITIDGKKSEYKVQTTAEVTRTVYHDKDVLTTCTREVPIGTRQECRYIPGDRQCHTVGGGEECRMVDGGRECSVVGGGRECNTVGGGQNCGLTPSGYKCHDVPGHQVCHDVPGREVCRDLPARRECYQLPGRQDCYDTPGRQHCETVTDYRTETYSCTQTISVPSQIVESEIINDVIVNVEINRQLPEGVGEVVELEQLNNKKLNLKSVTSTGKVLVYATQAQKEISNTGRVIKLETIVSVKLVDAKVAFSAFSSPMSEITIDSDGFEITTGLIVDPASVRFDVDLSRNKLFGKDESVLKGALSLAQATLTNSADNKTTKVYFDFEKLGVRKNVAGKKISMKLQLQSNIQVDNVINKNDIPKNLGQTKEVKQKLK